MRDLSVRGLRIGGTTTIVVSGDDLGKAPRLLLSAKQTLKPGNTDKRAEFDVELKDVPPGLNYLPPGLHHLRVVTEGGVSLPVVVGVDALEQKPFAPKVDALPVALSGALTGATVLETSFSGKAGQKVVIEVEAARLGSKLRPALHLYGAKKLQLEWAWGAPALSGDARIVATLPADGTYTVTLHDLEYAGPAPGHFRLKIGDFDYVDAVFPPVIGRGATSIELLGSRSAKIDFDAGLGFPRLHILRWPKEGTSSGPRPFVEVSSRPEFVEGNTPPVLAGRVGVSGKLSAPNEEDKYRVAVEPKSKVRFEVFAERLGSPLDVALTVYDEKGAKLAQAEDSPGSLDPVLEFAVPDKVTAVTVGVVDAGGRGGPRGIYRLTIDPARAAELDDIRLTTPLQRLSLPAGGRGVVPVYAERRGYAGPIELTPSNLPGGVKVEGDEIPPGADGALVTVTAPTDEDMPARVISWQGCHIGFARFVSTRSYPLERLQPWLATEFAVAPTTAKAADFSIDWKNLPADAALSPAGKLALPVALTRTDMASPVRLTLLTSQSPPLANGQPDPNRTLRSEKAVELGAKVSDGELTLLVPPDLPADSYQVAVLAELLTADKQRVQASAVTPVRTLKVKVPVAVRFDAPKLEAKLDAKANAALEVKGTVERLHGATGDVAVSLTGLPPGVPAVAPLTVKAADAAFGFKLTLPPTTPPGEYKLKLSATIAPDPKAPAVRVKSRDAEATLTLLAPPK